METYNGHVRTPADSVILFEACRIGLLPRVQRRLSEKERQSIKSGSVFVWDEREAGMRRWTDGKSWSASRVSGSFLTYREMEGKRGGSNFDKNTNRDGLANGDPDSDGGPDGYRYKPDGLMKQSFSITTNSGQHLHLISYFSRSSATSQSLMQPTHDPQLRHIRPERGMYPESTVHEQSNIPAVTRGPMSSPGYSHSPHQQSPYARPGTYGYGPAWAPPSPMHTPPPHPHYAPYYQPHPMHMAYGHPGTSPLQNMHYPPHPQQYAPPPAMTAFDRPPQHLSDPGLPPPQPHSYGQMPPYQQNGYPSAYGQTYQNGYSGYQPPPLQAPPYPPPQEQPRTFKLEPSTADNNLRKDETQDSHQADRSQQQFQQNLQQPFARSSAYHGAEQQASVGASAPQTSTQTIPSISAMLNGGANGEPPPRTTSRSPNDTLRMPNDIPNHKLGFEVNRDMQALRNLDKTTFKGY